MVGHTPQWEARRLRQPIPNVFPGYFFTPQSTGGLIYVFAGSLPTMFAVDAEAGQVIHEGQTYFVGGTSGDSGNASSAFPGSFSPTDGTLALSSVAGSQPSRAFGLSNRGGDTNFLFNATYQVNVPNEVPIDCANGPSGWCSYSAGSGVAAFSLAPSHLQFCRKSDGAFGTVTLSVANNTAADNCGIDIDRAGNVYVFHSNPATTGHYLDRRTPSGSAVNWFSANGNVPYVIPTVIVNKLIVVGTPELSGGSWFQSVYVANPSTQWLAKYDGRNGNLIVGGSTSTTNGWPYSLGAERMYAGSTGLYIFNVFANAFEKLNLDTLALLWRHTPSSAVPGLSLNSNGNCVVTPCGDLIYLVGPTTNGGVEMRKVNSADGSLAWRKQFFMPWNGSWMVGDWGRAGAFPQCGEPWLIAGKPAISS
jgi:hypothetical protein